MTPVFKKAWEIKVDSNQYKEPIIIDYPKAILTLVGIGFQTIGRLFPKKAAQVVYKILSSPRKNAIVYTNKLPSTPKGTPFSLQTNEGTTLHATKWGTSEKKILLIHDWEADSNFLSGFVSPLLKAGYQVITFDAPAHGCSEGKGICLPRYGRAIAHILKDLGDIDSIISHGMGSAGCTFALSKVNNSIELENLILISSPNDVHKILNDFTRMLWLPKSVKNTFFKLIEKVVDASIEEFDTSHGYYKMKVRKVLVVHDKKNEKYDYREAQENFFTWPNASLLTTENLYHFGPTQHKSVINEIVQFIQEDQVEFYATAV